MKRRLALVLSILLAVSAAPSVYAAEGKKNNVENIAAREAQEALDKVTGPAVDVSAPAGDAAASDSADGKPAEVSGTSAPDGGSGAASDSVTGTAPAVGEGSGNEAGPASAETTAAAASSAAAETTAAAGETAAASAGPGETAAPAETQAAEPERGALGTYLGNFKTTGYSNPDGSASADGTMPRAQHTVSTDWNVLPPGTRIRFGDSDIVYTVEDTGVRGNMVDVYYWTHSEAWNHGVQYKDVYLVN